MIEGIIISLIIIAICILGLGFVYRTYNLRRKVEKNGTMLLAQIIGNTMRAAIGRYNFFTSGHLILEFSFRGKTVIAQSFDAIIGREIIRVCGFRKVYYWDEYPSKVSIAGRNYGRYYALLSVLWSLGILGCLIALYYSMTEY